jgi:S-ribosylhomocysteine lyase
MKKIASFTIDHNKLERGIYISRKDGGITTFDLRMRKPYADPVLTDAEMHSLEHLLATELRNGPYKDHVIYVGPMGCATGFYALYRNLNDNAAVRDITDAFHKILCAAQMPGDSRAECGNCFTLDLAAGKKIAAEYLKVLSGKTAPDKYS